MSDIRQMRRALTKRILEGPGKTSLSNRRAAFDDTGLATPIGTLVDKIAHQACSVTDGDIAAAKGSGLNEDQIFEIVVCAAIGQSSRLYDAARKVLVTVARKE